MRTRGEVRVLWSCTQETWDGKVEERPGNKQEWAGEERGKERWGGESTRKILFENVITIYHTVYANFKIKSYL